MKILVIEDEAPVAEVLMDVLREDGHEVSVAHTGEDGLRHVERSCPDAIFLDVKLPGMSGVDVLRAIRAQDAILPVFVLTGHASPEEIEEMTRLRANEVILKPAILRRFSEALSSVSARPDPA